MFTKLGEADKLRKDKAVSLFAGPFGSTSAYAEETPEVVTAADKELLTDPETVYPVVIAPTWGRQASRTCRYIPEPLL